MADSDYVQFAHDEDQRDVITRALWSPPEDYEAKWPPPQRLGLLYGKSSNQPHRVVVGPIGEELARAHVEAQGFRFDDVFEIRWFTRISASKIPDEEALLMTHVARGAAYIPEVL